MTHLPAVAHLFGDHAAKRLPVVLARRRLKQPPLLLDGCKFRVSLVYDQVQQRIPHALVRNLHHLFPFRPPFVRAKLDLVRTRRTKFCFELVVRNLRIGDPDVLLPDSKKVDPIIKRGQACCRHSLYLLGANSTNWLGGQTVKPSNSSSMPAKAGWTFFEKGA